MQWCCDETLPSRLLSDQRYWITREPMARGCWYNAFTPHGALIASGQLQRCLEACETHLAGHTKGKGKRQFRPPFRRRPRRQVSMAVSA